MPIERAGGAPQPELELPPYSRAARFPGEAPAGRAYGALQGLLSRSELPTDLSCDRFQLNEVSHVAVLGEPPPRALDRQLARILAAGEPAALPEDVLRLLHARGIAARANGPWSEHHHRPGTRLT